MPSVAHSLDAERAVLGACLVDQDAIGKVAGMLDADDFAFDQHRPLFRHMRALYESNIPIDLVPLVDKLRVSGELDCVGGPAYITSLASNGVRAARVEVYARMVREKARDRWFSDRLLQAKTAVDGGSSTQARSVLRQLVADFPTDENDDLILEPVSTVAARAVANPQRYVIQHLMVAGCIGLWYGLERTFKSLACREAGVAVAMGRPAFHLERLAVTEAMPVAYVTEEDNASSVIAHVDAFSNGAASRGGLPFYLSACRGLSIDDPRTQDRLVRDITICKPGMIIIEPLRASTSCVDQGPRELQPLTAFIRRLIRETGAAILLGHHAVKGVAGSDARKGTQRVSGGGLVSIAECPAEFVRIDDTRVQFTPRSYKHSATPAPLQLRLETAGGQVSGLYADEYAPPPSEQEQTSARVLSAVAAEPGLSGSAVAIRVGGRKGAVLETLRVLGQAGRLKPEAQGTSTRWFLP